MIEKEYYNNGKLKFEYEIKNGEKEGFSREYYENGQLKKESCYKNGKLNGLCKQYYENGQLEIEATYKDGKIDALFKSYYKNGKLELESVSKEEKLNGLYKQYYENGRLKYDLNYKEEKLDGLCKQYYENGQLEKESYYKNGKLNGLCRQYYENGKLRLEENYINGKLNGVVKDYFDDGKIKGEYSHKEGELEGLCKIYEYYKNSKKIEKELLYKDGKPRLGKICYRILEKLERNDYYLYFGKEKKILYRTEVRGEKYTGCESQRIANYLQLNGERIITSEIILDKDIEKSKKEIINDNIKVKIDGQYKDLIPKYCDYIYSYQDIIGEVKISNKEIFFEREFIKDEMLNGLKVLYKKNNGIREYIKIELYENNVKIKDNIDDRRRLINQYFISNEEKEEWINIPFIEDLNYTPKNDNENIENIEVNNNKALYIILPIIGVLVFGIILYFVFFKENNDYQEVSTQSTTSYSQPSSQQKVVNSTVVENNNVNKYIPTVEDARYVNYKTYYNDNFDYSIDYPDDEYFKITKTYEDGMKLQNDNGEVLISLTSNWNPNGESLQQAYDKAVREKPNAPYKFLGKTFFTITYEDNGLLIFRKTMYDKNTNKYVYLYVSFPPEYKDYMTPIVERMANSMKKSVSNVTSTANNSYSDSQLENKFGRVVKDKYVGGSFIEFLRNADENEYYYLRDQFWEILNTMYVTEDNKTYYYLNDIIDQLETKADWDNSSRVISLEVKGNKMYYTVGFPKGYNANTPSWVQFEIFERKFNDGIGLRTAHVSCAINGVEYKDWDAVYAIFR